MKLTFYGCSCYKLSNMILSFRYLAILYSYPRRLTIVYCRGDTAIFIFWNRLLSTLRQWRLELLGHSSNMFLHYHPLFLPIAGRVKRTLQTQQGERRTAVPLKGQWFMRLALLSLGLGGMAGIIFCKWVWKCCWPGWPGQWFIAQDALNT